MSVKVFVDRVLLLTADWSEQKSDWIPLSVWRVYKEKRFWLEFSSSLSAIMSTSYLVQMKKLEGEQTSVTLGPATTQTLKEYTVIVT